MDLAFTKDEDFGTESHRIRRDEGWIGGPFVELPYFLSCLCRTNYCSLPREKWEPELRQMIAKQVPAAKWILGSTYFYEFSLRLLKDLYRNSDLGKRHPIAKERKRDAAARFAIFHPNISLAQMAEKLGTTSKQLERNCDVKLAILEYNRLSK